MTHNNIFHIKKDMKIKYLTIMISICLVFTCIARSLSASEVVTKQNIIDAVLERKTFTPDEESELDLNRDNLLDVADLIHYLKNQAPESLEGVYTGFFVRDNTIKTNNRQAEIFGQVPLSIIFLENATLEGKVNTTEDTETNDFKKEYYSLYFPDDDTVVVSDVSGSIGASLSFTISFETESESLAPDTVLSRTMVFVGDFSNSDEGSTLLSGTYTETINGIVNNWGNDLNIKLTGKFLLMKE